jgi:hypothetical protein
MKKINIQMKLIILLTLVPLLAISSDHKGNQALLKQSVPGAAFNSLGGSNNDTVIGCFINRPEGVEPDGNMYAALQLPVGATIQGISANFLDISQSDSQQAKIILRRSNGMGTVNELAIVESPGSNGYYENQVDLDTPYLVEENDFFDLLFIASGTYIINANYICGVEVFYLMNVQ